MVSVLPLIAILGVGWTVYRFQAQPFLVEQAKGDIRTSLSLKSHFVSSWLDERFAELGYFAGRIAEIDGDRAALAREARAFAEAFPVFAAAVLAGSDGRVVVDSEGRAGGFVGDREYYQIAQRGQKAVTPVLRARTTGRNLVVIAVPVPGRDLLEEGVLFAPVYLEALETAVGRNGAVQQSYTSLIDRNREIIATTYDTVEERSPLPAYADGSAPPQVVRNTAGRVLIRARARIDGAPWSLVVESPIDELDDAFNRYNVWLLVSVTVVAVILSVAAIAITYSIVVPIRRLEHVGRMIGEGNYNAPNETDLPRSAPIELASMLYTMRDMAFLISTRHEKLRHVSLTDELTAAANRRSLHDEGPRIVEMCAQVGAPCCALVLDIDHFKRVNDTFGHEAGDEVLTDFTRRIGRNLRGGDYLARYGGEEFVVLLPRTACSAGTAMAERVRRAVEEQPFRVGANGPGHEMEIEVTTSVGVSDIAVPSVDSGSAARFERAINEAIARADQALYEAKRRGRNRVSSECV
jgi:diguanylate cyclase (GGDEF)-like protein